MYFIYSAKIQKLQWANIFKTMLWSKTWGEIIILGPEFKYYTLKGKFSNVSKNKDGTFRANFNKNWLKTVSEKNFKSSDSSQMAKIFEA